MSRIRPNRLLSKFRTPGSCRSHSRPASLPCALLAPSPPCAAAAQACALLFSFFPSQSRPAGSSPPLCGPLPVAHLLLLQLLAPRFLPWPSGPPAGPDPPPTALCYSAPQLITLVVVLIAINRLVDPLAQPDDLKSERRTKRTKLLDIRQHTNDFSTMF
jgi:hypothetical protein